MKNNDLEKLIIAAKENGMLRYMNTLIDLISTDSLSIGKLELFRLLNEAKDKTILK
jgi:hypothetical protein